MSIYRKEVLKWSNTESVFSNVCRRSFSRVSLIHCPDHVLLVKLPITIFIEKQKNFNYGIKYLSKLCQLRLWRLRQKCYNVVSYGLCISISKSRKHKMRQCFQNRTTRLNLELGIGWTGNRASLPAGLTDSHSEVSPFCSLVRIWKHWNQVSEEYIIRG
jgi:hypothetical protein